MKKYSLLLLILAFTVFMNCSRSSNNNDEQQENSKRKTTVDILSNINFSKLQIEIGYVKGFKPTEEAIANLLQFIKKSTYKENIQIIYKELESPGEEKLELQKIANLEIENRTAYNNDETLGIYIYFADAPSVADEPDKGLVTLGAVYQNNSSFNQKTSMVIYEATLRDLAKERPSLILSLEAATLNHEFGHLFGLVDLGTTPVNPDHEDVESHNHCNVEDCLMKAELEFGNSMKKMLVAKNGLIPGLGVECLADLKANGGR